MSRIIPGILVLGFAIAATGCGGPTVDTEYVEGVVTLDGKPVAGATVTFVPVTKGKGISANGYTNEQGVYKLTAVDVGEETAGIEAGTTPGEYYVGVRKVEVETPPLSGEGKAAPSTPLVSGVGPKTTYIVPKKYNNPQTSGLKATVKEGENTIPLELTSN